MKILKRIFKVVVLLGAFLAGATAELWAVATCLRNKTTTAEEIVSLFGPT